MRASLFGHSRLWIAATSAASCAALETGVRTVARGVLPGCLKSERVCRIDTHDELCARLDQAPLVELFNSIVLVDLTTNPAPMKWHVDEADRHPLEPTSLPLRYPEVYWIFITTATPRLPARVTDAHFINPGGFHRLIDLLGTHAAGFRSLFDPTGLRRAILSKGTVNGPDWMGISVEDEVSYCSLNGYFLHRRGYGTYTVVTAAELARVGVAICGAEVAVIEDLELRFSDEGLFRHGIAADVLMPKMEDTEKSRDALIKRQALYGSPARLTRVVLSAQSLPANVISGDSSVCRGLVKPYAGFYDRRLTAHFPPRVNRAQCRRFNMPDFVVRCWTWSRDKWNRLRGNKEDAPVAGETSTHAASGRRQALATLLLMRCRAVASEVRSEHDALQVATLATLARDLLGNKTLHLSLEAIATQHRMEVFAECMFMGTSAALSVKDRMKEVTADVRSVVRHYSIDISRKRWKRSKQLYSALTGICAALRDVYRRFDKREEEDAILVWYRKWHCRNYYANLSYENWEQLDGLRSHRILWWVLAQLVRPFWAYLNLLMRGGGSLLLASLFWIFVFAVFFKFELDSLADVSRHVKSFEINWWDAFKLSLASFGNQQTSLEGGYGPAWLGDALRETEPKIPIKDRATVLKELKLLWGVNLAAMVLGYVHLGVFLSWVFQKFSRK